MLRDVSLDLTPGQYDPNRQREMAYDAKRTFARSASSGTMAFAGSTTARKMPIEIMGGEGRDGQTPDPGQYTDAKKGMADAASKMKSAVFHSGSQQRVNPIARDENSKPPVGLYHPDDSLTVQRPPNAAQSMQSKSARMAVAGALTASSKGWRGTGPDLAPGMHDIHLETIAGEVSKRVKSMTKLSRHAGFGGRSTARDLPHERMAKAAQDIPAPGQYEARSSVKDAYNSQHASVFLSATKRSVGGLAPGFKSEVQDPGQYDPNRQREMAYDAKRTFARSASSGTMAFAGSTTARKMPIEIMGGEGRDGQTPDPGQYTDAKKGMADAASKMKSAVFHSGSQQRVNPIARDENSKPPVGLYHPDDSLTVQQPPNAAQSMQSKSARFNKSMLFDRSYTTSDELGPGAYKVLSHSNGSRSTVAGSVAGQKALGRNASFRSESVRDLNSAFFANERTGF